MVVRADDGDMVTQRKTPRMALIKPKLDSGEFTRQLPWAGWLPLHHPTVAVSISQD
jgi:hypothetical protein